MIKTLTTYTTLFQYRKQNGHQYFDVILNLHKNFVISIFYSCNSLVEGPCFIIPGSPEPGEIPAGNIFKCPENIPRVGMFPGPSICQGKISFSEYFLS